MRTKLQQVFKNYGELLAERISNNILTSEDDVRYTFLYSLSKIGKYNPLEIELEKSYKEDNLKNDKMDLYVSPKRGNDAFAVEFKYHGPKAYATARTSDAGSIFWDFAKLSGEIGKNKMSAYFVYVLDEKMKKYFEKKKSLSCLLDLSKGRLRITKAYFKELPPTMWEWLKDKDKKYDFVTGLHCYVKSVFRSDFLKQQRHYLRIFSIER